METINQTENNQPNLGIQDLKVTLNIINTCTQRGAFRASELSTVGQLYDRLVAFLAANDLQETTADQQTVDTIQPQE
jgi:hypothetical protein